VIRLNRKLLACLMSFLIAMAHTPLVSAGDNYFDSNRSPTAGEMLADTVMVRPPMFLATLVGVATFIVTLPFSALGGNIDEAGKVLVLDPAEYTFLRPLGKL